MINPFLIALTAESSYFIFQSIKNDKEYVCNTKVSISLQSNSYFLDQESVQDSWKVTFLFFAFDICLFCVVIRFFIPATTANDLRLRGIFYPRFYPLHLFSYLNSWERASISLWMFSAKQGKYWYHFCNVFGMTRSLSGDWTRDLPQPMPAFYH